MSRSKNIYFQYDKTVIFVEPDNVVSMLLDPKLGFVRPEASS